MLAFTGDAPVGGRSTARISGARGAAHLRVPNLENFTVKKCKRVFNRWLLLATISFNGLLGKVSRET